ncbi:MAG: ChaN family lipoprotein [Thiomicrorhabdus chilensis]|uniref:ChaN family lipoprotein n=1 Tax=Thiomicrorhabdus chilensis TaxID=63656 RepID=UPI00299D6B60|nr:ChaN family lipoprotein [Thiomicrorhabdus chilensis]MDX1347986.1 ChaN family lipoprotein [Thiomicrorhabdus chilensis]
MPNPKISFNPPLLTGLLILNKNALPLHRLLHYSLGLLAMFALVNLHGCSLYPQKTETLPALQTLYDYVVLDSQSQTPISLEELAKRLKDRDVVFIGEFHGNHASHLLQAQLQALLYKQRPLQILSMEQFERHQQTLLFRYLDDEIGEAYLLNEAPAWDNYTASYRPMVEFAKQHFLPVVAANAPTDIVRCIGRQGQDYVGKLTEDERNWIAQTPFADIPGYLEKYQSWIQEARHLTDDQAQKSYQAQIVRDNTMAESILRALRDHPKHQVIHLNGAFHSAAHLGTVAALQRMAPNLKLSVISPIHTDTPHQPYPTSEDFEEGDFIYLLQSQPIQYVNASYRQKTMKRLFKSADSKPCL